MIELRNAAVLQNEFEVAQELAVRVLECAPDA